jgi:hypothetical protein
MRLDRARNSLDRLLHGQSVRANIGLSSTAIWQMPSAFEYGRAGQLTLGEVAMTIGTVLA